MAVQIQMRRDTAADWTSANPILAQGELGLEIDTARFKIGDGVLAWNTLLYANQVFNGPGVISANTTTPALRVTQMGTGNALVVEDSTNPDSSAFVVDSNGSVFIGPSTGIIALNVAVPAASKGVSFDYDEATDRAVIASIHQGVSFKPLALQGSELVFEPGATERMRINNAGNVGIGTSSPAALLHIQADTTNAQQWYRSGNAHSVLRFERANTSATSPAIVSNGNILAELSFRGYDGTNYDSAAAIRAVVDGTPGVDDMPGRLEFYTTPDGSNSSTERMRITSAGNVGIGTTVPAARLSVVSAGAATTEEVLFLENNYAVGGDVAVRVNMRTNGASRVFLEGGQWATGAGGQAGIYVANTSGTLTQRMAINPDGLFTGTGTSLGAWTAFTPTVSGITIGNGSITAAYSVIGKTCFARYDLTIGSTTTVGGSSNGLTLPLTMKSGQYATVIPFYFDASLAASYHGFGQTTSNYIYFDATNNANGKAENITTTTPFTWATSDRIIVSVVYEIA